MTTKPAAADLAWRRLELITAILRCRSEQFDALQANTIPRPPFNLAPLSRLDRLWINDQVFEEILIERELTDLEAGRL